MSSRTQLRGMAWGLVVVVVALAVAVWSGERLGRPLSLYDWFPLFGLLAFGLMWTHYIVGVLRRYFGEPKKALNTYFNQTSIMVLILILLHPLLLNIQLNKDGFGVPPESYRAVYPDAVQGMISLGALALIIFLAFELKRWLEKKSWWYIVEYAQILAMILIFFHALRLGRELSVDWYQVVWWAYGVSFLGAVIYNFWFDKRRINDGKE